MQQQSPTNRNKDAATMVRLDIQHVEMRHMEKYPFGQLQPRPESVVHLVKYFQQQDYEQQRNMIAVHERLSHPNLIQILKIIDSKRTRKLDLFYEMVPFSLSSRIKLLTNYELNQIRQSLYNLTEYLIGRGFLPQLDPQNLGLTSRNIIKYLLPISHRDIKVPHNKNELFQKKREQINTLMYEITKPLREHTSQQQLHKVVDPKFSKSKSESLMIQSVQRPLEKPSNDNTLSPQQRNSHNNYELKKSMSFQSLNKQQANLDIPKPGRGSMTPIIESMGANSNSLPNSNDPLTKLKNIDRQIKQLEGVKNNMDMNDRKNQLRQVRKSQIPQASNISPPPPPSPPQLQPQEPPKITQPIVKNVHHQPSPSPEKKYKKQFDQDSQDTYRQQLGENIEMPKITSNAEMRNTTMSPPKLFNDRSKDKLSESVGFQQQILLPVIAAASVRSQQTDNKTITIQNGSIRTVNDLQMRPVKKPTQNCVVKPRQPTQGDFQKQHYQIQIPEVLSSEQLDQIINNSPQLQQHLPHMRMSPNLNVNVNVAVNLNDLSKKVDAAYGRVRAVSQSNESGLKSPGIIGKQMISQMTTPKQEIRKQVHEGLKRRQPESPQHQQPIQPQHKKSPNVISKLTAIISNSNQKPAPHEKLTVGIVNPMDVHLSKNRKHSDTKPKLVLLSPTKLQNRKPSQPDNAQKPNQNQKGPQFKQAPKHSSNALKPPIAYPRKDSGEQIQDDFRELHKKKQKNGDPAVFEEERSREYLYHYENLFPDASNDYRDDTSIRNPQALQSHLDELYSQSLKFDKNDALISEFTTLFEAESIHRMPTGTRSGDVSPKSADLATPRTENFSMANEQQSRNRLINERVKLALKKSEATLQYFSKIKKGNPDS